MYLPVICDTNAEAAADISGDTLLATAFMAALASGAESALHADQSDASVATTCPPAGTIFSARATGK